MRKIAIPAAIIGFLLLVGILVLAWIFPVQVTSVAVIIVAFFNLVLLTIVIAIAVAALALVKLIHSEAPPVLNTVKRTATTVEGTADFVTTTAAMPIIRVVSLIFAASRFVQVLLGTGKPEEVRRS